MDKAEEETQPEPVTVKIEEYKCFSPESDEFSITTPVTLIFGPNGSGKTALTEVFKRDFSTGVFTIAGRLNLVGSYKLLCNLAFPTPDTADYSLCSSEHQLQSNINLIRKMKLRTSYLRGESSSIAIELPGHESPFLYTLVNQSNEPQQISGSLQSSVQLKDFDLHPTKWSGITSTRRVEPEAENTTTLPDGTGATATLQQWSVTAGQLYSARKREVIRLFNWIVDEHERISDYRVVYTQKPSYAIELEYPPETKPLSNIFLHQTGAGFQSILLTILTVSELLPATELDHYRTTDSHGWQGQTEHRIKGIMPRFTYQDIVPPERRLIILEEIEAHLHPKTVRRLLDYVFSARSPTDQLVLTSHSPVVLDYVASRNDVQLLHLQVKGGRTVIKQIPDQESRHLALSQIGAMPSDLCFSNAVIWVEGPSDRLYLQWLIGLYTDLKLIEGYHYSIMWFGGANVSHITFQHRTEELNQKASLIAINPNSYLVIDSDLYGAREQLKDNAKAALTHLESKKQAWVTSGSEFENYLPLEILKLAEPQITDPQMPQDRLPFTPRAKGTGESSIYTLLTGKTTLKKVPFAQKVVEEMREKSFADSEIQALHNSLDFKNQIRSLIEKICEWNNLSVDSVWAYREPGSENASN